jgi:hypothetical protein
MADMPFGIAFPAGDVGEAVAPLDYGAAIPALTGTVGGFVNGQTLASATTGTLGFSTGATPSSNVSSYAITGSGLAANNGNYVFVQTPGNANAFAVTPGTLTYVGARFGQIGDAE